MHRILATNNMQTENLVESRNPLRNDATTAINIGSSTNIIPNTMASAKPSQLSDRLDCPYVITRYRAPE